jgi:hypothetical protein
MYLRRFMLRSIRRSSCSDVQHPGFAVIGVTHFFIDRFRLARYVCWYKNFIAPRSSWPSGPITPTGYADSVPVWLSTWLLIITDNAMHLIINGLALYYLA